MVFFLQKFRKEKDEKVLRIPFLKAVEFATIHESVSEDHEIDKQTAEKNVNKISPEISEDDVSSEEDYNEDGDILKTFETKIKTFSPLSKIPRPQISRQIPPSPSPICKSKIPVLKNNSNSSAYSPRTAPKFIPRRGSNSITDTKKDMPFGNVLKGVSPTLLKRLNSKPNVLE